jgi:hypothetical protein
MCVYMYMRQGRQTGIAFVDSTPISVCHNKRIRRHKTPGNTDDRKPLPILARELWGKLVGDKGYISQDLFEKLFAQGLHLITTTRKDMKNRLMPVIDRVLARKRSLIETINDQLKNISQIAHTRHRSPCNFLVNFLAALIAYSWQPNKPSLNLSDAELAQLPAII